MITGTTKVDLGGGLSHPARFSTQILEMIAEECKGSHTILDPFAGTGLIHKLQEWGYQTVGVEIEPEWAILHPDTIVGDATCLPFADGFFDGAATSPCFGNRLSDHYNASDPHTRRSYKFDLGRDLHINNAGRMRWGEDYKNLHKKAWIELYRVLAPGGLFVLNIKDHYRNKQRQYVSNWHLKTLKSIGFTTIRIQRVGSRGMKHGANRELRIPYEYLITFTK